MIFWLLLGPGAIEWNNHQEEAQVAIEINRKKKHKRY